MRGDALSHLGVTRFGGRAIGASVRGVLDEPLGIAAFARAGAAQDQSDGGKTRSVRAVCRQWLLLLRPRNRPSSRDAEVSWLGVVARGAFPAGSDPASGGVPRTRR